MKIYIFFGGDEIIMKKITCLTALFVVVDQIIKVFISNLYMGTIVVLIPNVLLFRPVQNKNLSYFGSLFETKVPLAAMILLEVVSAFVVVMIYRYCLFIYKKQRKLPILFLCLGLAGVICAFIDSLFWGGSIDFIRLFDWFTFDLKDVYLSSMSILMISYMFFITPEYYKLNKEDRRKYDLILWIKKGCPTNPD